MIAVIGTGGTISSTAEVEGGAAVPRLDVAALLERAKLPQDGLRMVDFATKMSSALTVDDALGLAAQVEAAIADGADAVVITQGTATLAESAYLLDLLLGDVAPVAMTGAMVPASEIGTDGPANLRDALLFAEASRGHRRGVYVIAGGEVHSPARVMKHNGASVAGFVSYGQGPLGRVDGGELVMRLERPARTERFAGLEPGVEIVTAGLGSSTVFLEAAAAARLPGLVIAGFAGRGTVPPSWVPPLSDYVAAGGIAVFTAQSPVGRVVARHGKEGSARDLAERGVIMGGDLAPTKARCLLMAVLARTRDVGEVERAVRMEWECQ